MKRFWDEARVEAADGGFAVRLDGRPVRLPGGGTLAVPQQALAEALAAEWQAAGGGKGGAMRWDDVPMTRLVGTAAERIAPDPAATVAAIAEYGGADLLCYRAEEAELAAAQAAGWDPWLGWARDSLGAELAVTTGIIHVAQPSAALRALEGAVAAHGPEGLAALGVLVPALGSLVLGLAVAQGALEPAEAHRLSILDELHQEARWGLDWEAEERRARVAGDIAVAARLAALVR